MELTHPLVRELAWCCFSADQLQPQTLDAHDARSFAPALDPQRRCWLMELDRSPAGLTAHIGELTSRRLGLRFEAFWRFFLEHDDRYELLATNLPVREAGHTLGEFDIIVGERETGHTWHLELAVKFYLGIYGDDSGPTPWDRWWGPSRHDRLDLKLEHLLGRQLCLADQPASAAVLDGHSIAVDRRAAVLRGWMFYPYDRPRRPPAGLRNDVPAGRWLSLKQLAAAGALHDATFCPLAHDQWLQPNADYGATLSHAAFTEMVATELERRPTPRMALARIGDDGAASWQRLFVTPANWENQATLPGEA